MSDLVYLEEEHVEVNLKKIYFDGESLVLEYNPNIYIYFLA